MSSTRPRWPRRLLHVRPRLLTAAAIGAAAAPLLPAHWPLVTRALVAWNLAVWLYLLLMAVMMVRADHARLRRTALAHAEGAAVVLGTVIAATVASLAGIVVQLAQAKTPGSGHATPHVLLAVATVAGAWLLMPTLFALSYATAYYVPPRRAAAAGASATGDAGPGSGLAFPGADAGFRPNYVDFLYVSFTIAVAAQTSDVAVTSRPLRRLVLLQSVLSFVFNTAVLALSINIAAGLL